MKRCSWATESKPLLLKYHDTEWGTPIHNDREHFELLSLEGQQAGLSFELILKKREAYRKIFYDFDPQLVAKMSDEELAEAATNPAIVRHQKKLLSIRQNANAFLNIQKKHHSFDAYIWSFVGGEPQPYQGFRCLSPESTLISKELIKWGFSFVGPKIIYSYLQAAGLVFDHDPCCFRSSGAKGQA